MLLFVISFGHRNLVALQVKSHEQSWKNVKKQLKKDRRYDSSNLLDRKRKEDLFAEHCRELQRKRREEFFKMLDETEGVTLSARWKDVRELVKEDPRLTKFSSSDRVNL